MCPKESPSFLKETGPGRDLKGSKSDGTSGELNYNDSFVLFLFGNKFYYFVLSLLGCEMQIWAEMNSVVFP